MKTLLFILKTAFIVIVTGWILQYNGSITVQLEDHLIRLSCAESCLAILSVCGLWFIFGYSYFSLTKGRRYRKNLKKLRPFEQAIDFLTKSYAALLIKDGNSAQEWTQKTRKILKDSDFVLYLEAEALVKQEEKSAATAIFKKIVEGPYPMFGIIPLITHHLISLEEIIELLNPLLQKNPEEKWMWRLLLDLTLQTNKSSAAIAVFKKMQKNRLLTGILKDFEADILLLQREQALQQGDIAKAFHFSQKAYENYSSNETVIIAYVRDLCHQHQQSNALEILSKQWRQCPSLTLAEVFTEIGVNLSEDEKTKWKNHLLNSCADKEIKNFLISV